MNEHRKRRSEIHRGIANAISNHWKKAARTLPILGSFHCLVLFSASARGATDGFTSIGEMNCTACHAASEKQAAWILPKVAPRISDVGNRASGEWLQRFLASPSDAMPGTTMPDMLHGDAEKAEALTHFLVSSGQHNFRRVAPDRGAVARGDELFHSVGCVACHSPQRAKAVAAGSVPLPMMAEKWSFDGLRRFLLDPLATRPSGRMPAMRLTDGEAADIAHYLLRDTKLPAAAEIAYYRGRMRSLDGLDSAELSRTVPANGFTLEGPSRDRGAAVRFSAWLNVEKAGDYTFFLNATGASRFSIDGQWVMGEDSWEAESVKEKHALRLDTGRHELEVDYIHRGSKDPSLAVEWEGPGIMREIIPPSRLSAEREPVAEPLVFVVDKTKAEKGRALYASLNCAACHEAKSPAQNFPSLASLTATRGCLAEKKSGAVPDFHFDAAQRASLRESLAALNRADITAPTSQERLSHTMNSFRCTACHIRDGNGGVNADRSAFFTANVDDLGDEGRLPPRLDGVGDKLQIEWIRKVLGEGASVRPYMNTRMPQFGATNVGHLADLFVALDRHALPVAPVSDKPETQREVGRKLSGTDGLSCIACHRFNRQPAHQLQVIDLTTAPERLNEDWFRQFLRDPNRFHPGTRMPMLWPGGRSLLPDVLDGDTDRQHAALWTYFSDGPKAKFPEGLSRQNMELIVAGEAVVYRGKLWEAGFRAVATGYPGQLNAAFDAEEMRLAILWRGRFLNVSPHWSVQGMGQIRPLGTDQVLFPHGSPFAILADSAVPWPRETGKDLGMKFSGYQLDKLKQPTLLYSFRTLNVEDFLTPRDADGKSALHRTLKFTGAAPDGLHLRIAAGKLAPDGEHAWRLDGALTINAGAKSFVRGTGEKQELLVPVRVDAEHPLEIEYVW